MSKASCMNDSNKSHITVDNSSQNLYFAYNFSTFTSRAHNLEYAYRTQYTRNCNLTLTKHRTA